MINQAGVWLPASAGSHTRKIHSLFRVPAAV
jgi:hypothetical protein